MSGSLHGRRVLVTRPAEQAGALATLIEAAGGSALRYPLLAISAADDTAPLQRAMAELDTYALAIFISPNAVDYSVPAILAARTWPVTLRVAAIGPGTTARLAHFGVAERGAVVAPQERYDSESLLALPEMQKAAVAGARVLILRGNGGRELLAETLLARGATVVAVSCYQRTPPGDSERLHSLLRDGALDALTVSSSEGLRNLMALAGPHAELCRRLPLFVPHRRIAEVADELGWCKVVLTGPADDGILASLCTYRWTPHE